MADYKNLSDVELTCLLKASNHAAFTEIYNRYWLLLFNHARRMLKDDEQAKDVVQDTFNSLFDKTGKLQVHISLSAYLYQTVRYMIFNLIRHEKVKINYLNSIQAYFQTGVCSTDELIREKELKQQIEQEIEMLPAKMRRIFELSRKAHLSYKEIAEQTMTSEGTVRKQVYYALKILRGKLGSQILFHIMAGLLWLNRMLN